MPDSIEQILRVADWRVKGLKTRLAQCTLVAVLAYGGSKSELVAVWYAVTMLIGVADAWVFRHLRRHADHSLSRRLARAMGAELAFDSEIGCGTTAILRLPA